MENSEQATSLQEQDYLTILKVVTEFFQCTSRIELLNSMEKNLLPLFEADTCLNCWGGSDLAKAQIIGTVGIENSIANDLLPYDPLSKVMTKSMRPVMAYDVDHSREEIGIAINCFIQDNPQYKKSDYQFLQNFVSCIIAMERPEFAAGIGIHRLYPNNKPWTLRHIRMLELIQPHIFQVYKTVIIGEELVKFKSLIGELTEQSIPLALISANMRLVFSNPAFSELLHVDKGNRLPEEMAGLLETEIAKFEPPFQMEHAEIELSFYELPDGLFRLCYNPLNRKEFKNEDYFLLRLKPAIEPISRMNRLMQQAKLTPREMEICILVKDGIGDEEISKRLFVSENTVKTHLKNIFKKMEIQTRPKLIAALTVEEEVL
jgi:DNA-binding CsgD family transcriptional regulator